VQLGADRLRKGLVGGVADQEVAKTVCVLVRKLWPVGTDEIAPDEGRQPWQDLRFLRRERLDGASVEQLALHRSALEHLPLRLIELVEPRRQ
jgi:hypothetical protein